MKAKRILAFICSIALTAGMSAGCGSKDNKEIGGDGYGKASDDTSEHVEITLGGINLTNSDSVEGWPTEVVEKLEKKFNVTLKTKQ